MFPRLLIPAALMVLSACASRGASPPGTAAGPPPRVDRVGSSGYDVRLDADVQASVAMIQATPEAAWAGLLAAYAKLEIPLTRMDAAAREAGNPSLQVRRRLGGQPLSRYMDCGTNLSGVIANSYRVELSIGSRLQSGPPGQVLLHTQVTGSAVNPQGASSTPVHCVSTGRLEQDLANLTKIAAG